jgi:uncharacterized RDD family membrane protein YckC
MSQIVTSPSIDNEVVTIDPSYISQKPNLEYDYSIWLRWCARAVDIGIIYNLLLFIVFLFAYLVFGLKLNEVYPIIFNSAFILIVLLTIFLYKPIMVTLFRQSPGQKLCGLQYITINGNKPTFWRILGRQLCELIPYSTIISFVMILVNKEKKQSLYDIICKTTVPKYKHVNNFFIKWFSAFILLNIVLVTGIVFLFIYVFSQLPKSTSNNFDNYQDVSFITS